MLIFITLSIFLIKLVDSTFHWQKLAHFGNAKSSNTRLFLRDFAFKSIN